MTVSQFSIILNDKYLLDVAGGKGDWSTKGCILKGLHSGVYQCSCNHMTNFAILLDVSTRPLTSTEYKTLSVVSYIGCIISLLGLLATVVTFSSFRSVRRLKST